MVPLVSGFVIGPMHIVYPWKLWEKTDSNQKLRKGTTKLKPVNGRILLFQKCKPDFDCKLRPLSTAVSKKHIHISIVFRICVLPCEDIEMYLHVRNDEERVNSTKEKGSSL
jgi:hypothetical protein